MSFLQRDRCVETEGLRHPTPPIECTRSVDRSSRPPQPSSSILGLFLRSPHNLSPPPPPIPLSPPTLPSATPPTLFCIRPLPKLPHPSSPSFHPITFAPSTHSSPIFTPLNSTPPLLYLPPHNTLTHNLLPLSHLISSASFPPPHIFSPHTSTFLFRTKLPFSRLPASNFSLTPPLLPPTVPSPTHLATSTLLSTKHHPPRSNSRIHPLL